jgi:hypothetical protein
LAQSSHPHYEGLALMSMGGGGTQTATEVNQPDPWVTAAGQQTYGSGIGLLGNFLGQASPYAVAGVNPDQEMGYALGRTYAADAFNPNKLQTLNQTDNAKFAPGTAAQLDPSEIAKLANPYTDMVARNVQAGGYRDWQDKDADLAASGASANAFGGSGPWLARAALAKGANENMTSTLAQLYGQGFDKAAALAGQNTANRQQMAAQGEQLANNMQMQNAQMSNQYGLANAQLINSNAQQTQAQRLSAIQQLINGGNAQRDITNQALQWPYQALQMLNGITPKATGSTTTKTTPDNTPSPLMQILGLGLSAAKFL